MAQKVSSLGAIMKALPAVQDAVREEIAARIAAGEDIASVEDDVVTAKNPSQRDLRERRKELMERHAASRAAGNRLGRRSAA